MKKPSRAFDYISIFKYLLIFALFLLFNSLEKTVFPYSLSLLSAELYLGSSIIIFPLLFILSFITLNEVGLLACAAIASLIEVVYFLLYRKFNYKNVFSAILLSSLSLIGFLFIIRKYISLLKNEFLFS